MLSEEVLNNFDHSGNPPHKLNLKVNDICIVLRNLNKKAGLTNNTRVIVLHISRFVIKVQTLYHSSLHTLDPQNQFQVSFTIWRILSAKQKAIPIETCILHIHQQVQRARAMYSVMRFSSKPIHAWSHICLGNKSAALKRFGLYC